MTPDFEAKADEAAAHGAFDRLAREVTTQFPDGLDTDQSWFLAVQREAYRWRYRRDKAAGTDQKALSG